MKKLIVIATLFLLGLGCNVMAGVDPSCYLKTGEKTYFGQKLKIGLKSTKIISNDGTVVKVPNSKVKCCMEGSRFFELLPTVNVEYDTTGYVIMEYVTSKNGLKLYFYDNLTKGPASREFYVFADEGIYLKGDEKNASNMFAFFGITSQE